MESAILQSKLEFARTKVADQRDAIQRMTVKAPRAGTLILRSDWRGQKKQVGDRVWRADKVLEIPDLSRMEASAEVDERSAGRLAEGQPVTLRLDAYPDREYRAIVGLIRRAVQVKSWQNRPRSSSSRSSLRDRHRSNAAGMRFCRAALPPRRFRRRCRFRLFAWLRMRTGPMLRSGADERALGRRKAYRISAGATKSSLKCSRGWRWAIGCCDVREKADAGLGATHPIRASNRKENRAPLGAPSART